MMVKRALCDLWKSWQQFWFAPLNLYAAAMFRCVFGATLFFMYGLRFLEFETFFTAQGMMSAQEAKDFIGYSLRPLFFAFPESEVLLYWAHVLFLVLIIFWTLGLVNRWGGAILYLLHLGFIQRNTAVVYGADTFATFLLLYMCLIPHHRVLSVKNLLKKKKPESFSSDVLGTVGVRLIQLQMCIAYAYTGMEKLKGSQWWEGSALWYVLGNRQLVTLDFTWISHVPWVIAGFSFLTLVFEIYFPFAIWSKRLRRPWLVMGVGFHGGVGLIMGLPFFSLVMLSTYFLFLSSKEIFVVKELLSWPMRRSN